MQEILPLLEKGNFILTKQKIAPHEAAAGEWIV